MRVPNSSRQPVQVPNPPSGDDSDSAGESKGSKKGKRKREPKLINPYAKKYAPGGDLHDYFFEAAPKWTVGGALRRLLTKVRHNPNATISIHKFIKDSCKGNLKDYFTQVRNSLNRGDTMVMAEVAYKSFVQLTDGDKPLLHVILPKHKPRSRAAAVSEGGYAFKDYIIQVTKHGFDLMNAKMVFDDVHEDQQPSRKRNKQFSAPPHQHAHPNTTITTNTNNNNTSLALHQSPLDVVQMSGGFSVTEPFVPNISEQEQEIANNMILFLKVHIDGLLATIHHLRNENENLKKEKLERQQLSEFLKYDCLLLRSQLRLTFNQGGDENQTPSMLIGGNLSSDAFPSPAVLSTSSSYASGSPTVTSALMGIDVGGMSTSDVTVNYLASLNSSFLPESDFNVSLHGGAPVPMTEEHPQ